MVATKPKNVAFIVWLALSLDQFGRPKHNVRPPGQSSAPPRALWLWGVTSKARPGLKLPDLHLTRLPLSSAAELFPILLAANRLGHARPLFRAIRIVRRRADGLALERQPWISVSAFLWMKSILRMC